MSSTKVMGLLQASLALIGMAWKWQEDFAPLDAANLSRSFNSPSEQRQGPWPGVWLEALAGISIEALGEYWPWFSLHLFLYVGQLIPFIIIIVLVESPLERGPWSFLRTVATLGGLSSLCGFSTAMPAVSLWILCRRRLARPCGTGTSRIYHRAMLGSLLLFSAVTHIGAFSVALVATWAPSLLAEQAIGPLHIMNSLLDVPAAPAHAHLPSAVVRQARLRHINEMTGTSSGFFLAAGLLWRALESRGRHVTSEMLMWMFLVSLIAGPAAGAAAVLLIVDCVLGDERGGRLKEDVKTQ